MPTNDDLPIAISGMQQLSFVIMETPEIKKVFGNFTLTVPFGFKAIVFFNGAKPGSGAFSQPLGAGKHTGFNLLDKITYWLVDVREKLFPMKPEAMIRGPEDTDETGKRITSPSCRVKIPITLNVRTGDVDKILSIVNPSTKLENMIKTQIIKIAPILQYDEFGSWTVEVMEHLKNELSKSDTGSLNETGIVVSSIDIGMPEAISEHDKQTLQLFKLSGILKAKIRAEAASGQVRELHAESTANVAQTLSQNSQSLLLHLLEQPDGIRIIEADVTLRKAAIAAGLMQPGSERFLPPTTVTEIPRELPKDETSPSPERKSEPFPGDDIISEERIQEEIEAFKKDGYVLPAYFVNANRPDAVDDSKGNRVKGGVEIDVIEINTGNTIARFTMLPGYPKVSPVVQVRSSNGELSPYESSTLQHWRPAMHLNDIMQEVQKR